MIQRPKGTKDLNSNEALSFQFIYKILTNLSAHYNFQFVETPIFEDAALFQQSVGEGSDIVSKEMYLFQDRSDRQLALRPEGTAGIIRAAIENKWYISELPLKYFYYGPMFRYERPQKGRQRQFHQYGVEILGKKNIYEDLEVILFANSILKAFNIKNVKLILNSLGDQKTQDSYKKALQKYFLLNHDKLSKLSQQRLKKNVLRILDSKEVQDQELILKAPSITDYYSEPSLKYFMQLQKLLNDFDIKFEVNNTLVRGLDYYNETIFEFVSTSKSLGSQSTIIGGGRYDHLMKSLQGPDLSGIGFAIGIERLSLEIQNADQNLKHIENEFRLDVYVINLSNKHILAVAMMVQFLRLSGLKVEWNLEPQKLTKGFNKAQKYDPKFIVIAGEKELNNNSVIVKNQENMNQTVVEIENLAKYLTQRIFYERN